MPMLLRLLTLFLLFSLILPAAPVALAQDVTPRHSDPGWQAFYWNNPDLTGAPVVQRMDNDLNFDWGFGSPDGLLYADNFSARWERYIDVTPGAYRFTAVVDDGIRVWVDNELIINQWREQSVQTYTAEKYLGPGHHLVRVEYFERSGGAVARLSWTLNTPGPTPTPIGPPTAGEWRAEYYNNVTLSGAPVLVHNDPEINFVWSGSPAPGVAPDDFSVRWTRNLNLAAGNYRFSITVDDGARLFVNGHTLIDAWKEQGATTYSGDIYLPGGPVTVQMEYFESRGGASARLTWQQVGGGGQITDWQGEYFNNRNLSGTPALVRNDRDIDFDWRFASPAPGVVNADEFSVRWTRSLDLAAGNYRFTATTDDGVRLYVSGRLLFSAWREQSPTTVTGDIYLSGGRVPVQMEYFEASGGASARLRWERIGSPPPPTPATPAQGNAVIVDNGDTGFVKGGSARGWRTEPEGHGGSLIWTQNNDRVRPNYNWGRWYPSLTPGRYEVFVYIPDRFTTTSNARYWVSHQGGVTSRPVNQSAYSNQWVSLGVYTFRGTRDDYVSLADVTLEPRLSRLIAWDAVKWEPR